MTTPASPTDGTAYAIDPAAQAAMRSPRPAGHGAVRADRITRLFGIEWEQRDRGQDRNPAWELTPVPEPLVREFSSRSRHIDAEKDRLIDNYIATHGRPPSRTKVIELRARATLATRPCSRPAWWRRICPGFPVMHRTRIGSMRQRRATGSPMPPARSSAFPPMNARWSLLRRNGR